MKVNSKKKFTVKRSIISHALIALVLSSLIFYLVMSLGFGVYSAFAYFTNTIFVMAAYVISYMTFTVIPDQYNVKVESSIAVCSLCLSIALAVLGYVL